MRYPDDYDLERSHEFERQLDRDFEREPYRRTRRCPRFRGSSRGMHVAYAYLEPKAAA